MTNKRMSIFIQLLQPKTKCDFFQRNARQSKQHTLCQTAGSNLAVFLDLNLVFGSRFSQKIYQQLNENCQITVQKQLYGNFCLFTIIRVGDSSSILDVCSPDTGLSFITILLSIAQRTHNEAMISKERKQFYFQI